MEVRSPVNRIHRGCVLQPSLSIPKPLSESSAVCKHLVWACVCVDCVDTLRGASAVDRAAEVPRRTTPCPYLTSSSPQPACFGSRPTTKKHLRHTTNHHATPGTPQTIMPPIQGSGEPHSPRARGDTPGLHDGHSTCQLRDRQTQEKPAAQDRRARETRGRRPCGRSARAETNRPRQSAAPGESARQPPSPSPRPHGH